MADITQEYGPWPSKYRPRTLNEYVGHKDVKQKMREYIDNNDIPHLLFHSRPGTGKSALAKILMEQIDCEYLYINASNERGIDTVREKVMDFARIAVHDLKIIVLDEFDQFTKDAQKALRNPMVDYADHTRFILTANYPEDINDAIKSRVQEVEIEPHSRKESWKILVRVLEGEGIEYNEKDAKKIVDEYYPDLRKITNVAQKLTVGGKLKYDADKLVHDDFNEKVVKLLNAVDGPEEGFKSIRKLVQNEGVQRFGDTYEYLYQNMDEFASDPEKPGVILVIKSAMESAQTVPDKEINFMDCIVKTLREIK